MQTRIESFIFYWLPLVLYCLMIFIQSSKPSFKQLPQLQYFDKFLHFVAYALLGILFFRAFRTLRLKERRQLLMVSSMLCATLYGIGDEIHQYFVPFREASFADVMANALGSGVGVYIYGWRVVSNQ